MTTGISTTISPEKVMSVLSQKEVQALSQVGAGKIHETLRQCTLAVLNCGSEIDDSRIVLEQFKNFTFEIQQRNRGIKLQVENAPASAFVDDKIIKGIKENMFAVIRDIVYIDNQINNDSLFDLSQSESITSAVFHILRNAKVLKPQIPPDMVVCWGGHSINRVEYDYTKEVGYQLGLRELNICTGCGPGAMKGPMKGAAIAHAKQRISNGRYLGFSEPGIIAAESPNPIVNNLVILPDIEKRLEAFVRAGHGFIVFPGGVGTTEEILYLLGILLHPDNKDIPFPLVFTGPESSKEYFQQIDQFIGLTLGKSAQSLYEIIIDNPVEVARKVKQGVKDVHEYRTKHDDAYYFNWLLKIDHEFQKTFHPTHETMSALSINKELPAHLLAVNLRKAFSGIVAGNIKEHGIQAIDDFGPFEITADKELMQSMDELLQSFVQQQRMKVNEANYKPCYCLKT